MWYEILPSVCIIGACLYVPRVINQKWHKFKAGTEQNRDLRAVWDRTMLIRDIRLAGSPWRTIERAGLETIPD